MQVWVRVAFGALRLMDGLDGITYVLQFNVLLVTLTSNNQFNQNSFVLTDWNDTLNYGI